jgi:hypothetical protein
VNELIESKKNFWRDALAKWQITGVEPYAVAAKPSPELIARNDSERAARANAEAQRLATQYGLTDPQEAIKRYRTDYDAETARIDTAAKAVAPPKFVDAPPMTIDDGLKYATTKLAHDVPMVASTLRSTGATTGKGPERLIAFDPTYRSGYPPDPGYRQRQAGVVDEMTERLRNEILSLNAS